MVESIFQTIEHAKNQTGLALARSFDRLSGKAFTESELAGTWREEWHQDQGFYEEGWYAPPPNGIITLFGSAEDNYQRISQPSFRPSHMWPAENKYSDDDIIIAYASPVHRRTHLMGDFGLNLYRGRDKDVHTHFEKVLRTTLMIANIIKVGMPFKDIYEMAMNLGTSEGFMNNIASSTDKTGTNVGHTIPLSYKSDPAHVTIAQSKSFEEIKRSLSNGRKFINSEEEQCVEEDMAFTIEPRFSTDKMPNTWFHLTVVFEKGTQRICHGFRPVFERFSMAKLINLLPA